MKPILKNKPAEDEKIKYCPKEYQYTFAEGKENIEKSDLAGVPEPSGHQIFFALPEKPKRRKFKKDLVARIIKKDGTMIEVKK